MEFYELCRFCATNLADLQIQLFSKKDPNLQEIVQKFFPIKVFLVSSMISYNILD